jgi:hypothetical protein
MEIYDSEFIALLRKQLSLDKFTLNESRQPNTCYIYSPSKDRYKVCFPYKTDYHFLLPFDSSASPYQKACDVNLIETHIAHCVNIKCQQLQKNLFS